MSGDPQAPDDSGALRCEECGAELVWEVCDACFGTGDDDEDGFHPDGVPRCPMCDGQGGIEYCECCDADEHPEDD